MIWLRQFGRTAGDIGILNAQQQAAILLSAPSADSAKLNRRGPDASVHWGWGQSGKRVAACPDNLHAVAMQARRLDENELAKAVRALCRKEPRFRPVVKQHGVPSLRTSPAGLETLLTMVTEQFLSLSAAAAIWKRLKLRLDDCHHSTVLACPQERTSGAWPFTRQGTSFHGLAQAVAMG